MTATVIHGDCIAEMRAMADASVDAIVTDPPYHLTQNSRGGSPRTNDPETPFGRHRLADKGFMGKEWDGGDIAMQPEVWREALRVLRPGGHLLSFGGARTYHRMACAIEDAGFEIRDQIMWLYGSGFPKSLDVSKQLDKMAGAEREVIGKRDRYLDGGARQNLGNANNWGGTFGTNGVADITAPATPEAVKWQGWGTALKPAHEPVVVARKPFIGKVAQNVLTHGCGALNIDASRINPGELIPGGGNGKASHGGKFGSHETNGDRPLVEPHTAGRWPANVITDGSPEVLDAFAECGERQSRPGKTKVRGVSVNCYGEATRTDGPCYAGDTGTAARFFFCAKASRRERQGSSHPTVKPLSLMRYLCKLVTPPGGVILDPFAGSGTTLLAAQMEGFDAVGIEQDAAYVADARRRLGLTFELEAAD